MFKNVYKNKKILVTGHTGFKGAWLTLWLTQLGAEVIGYSLEPPTEPNLFDSLHLKNKIKHLVGDVRDLAHLKKVINQYPPEIIFHLAAQAIVKKAYEEPRETYETNVMGAINVFEAARHNNRVRAIVNVTSDKCYENKEWTYGYRENDIIGGRDPYSSSKGCSELVTLSYRQSFFNKGNDRKNRPVGLASARAGNVIGGGDWGADRLIPDCIKALVHHKTIVLRSPQAVRPWQFILESLSGYLWLGALLVNDALNYSEAWNFGPKDGDVMAVQQMAKKIINIWGKGSLKIQREKFYEPSSLKLDINKARHALNWQPVYDVHRAIDETVDWYKEYYLRRPKNMFDFSLAQIEAYEDEASKSQVLWSKK